MSDKNMFHSPPETYMLEEVRSAVAEVSILQRNYKKVSLITLCSGYNSRNFPISTVHNRYVLDFSYNSAQPPDKFDPKAWKYKHWFDEILSPRHQNPISYRATHSRSKRFGHLDVSLQWTNFRCVIRMQTISFIQ